MNGATFYLLGHWYMYKLDFAYCGWLYFCGYNFSWIRRKWHISGVQNRGHIISFHNSYRKTSTFRAYWNSWGGPSTKTMKIGTPRNSSHPQYLNPRCRQHENINFVPCWTPTRSRKLVLQNLYVVNKEVQIFMS